MALSVQLFLILLSFVIPFSTSQSPPTPPSPPTHNNSSSSRPADINEWCATVHIRNHASSSWDINLKFTTQHKNRNSDAWRLRWCYREQLQRRARVEFNRTLHGLDKINASCTNSDIQIWLTTALTNLETCRISANDLNVTDFVLPHVSYNVSDLISNSLAINKDKVQKQYFDGNYNEEESFPSWVGREERRLLMSRSLVAETASFVVAKDGSGQYRTVQTVIDVAARSGASGRKVIYVKRGVYGEYLGEL
ncbi:hypothetical protein Ancab_010235 [Ancistrocladus abbreviatus]